MNRIIKYASLLMAAVMLISCGGTVDSGDGSTGAKTLKLVADKNLIQTFGGDYAALTVTLDGEVVTEGVTFFDGKNNVLPISDFKFSTDKVGEYKIWANVGTYNSETITIKAIDIAIPDTPADPKPESTDFKARVLLTEFTTTGCSACPAMKTILHDLEADKAVCEKVVFTECHSGLIGGVADPCYLHNQSFEDFCMINGYPTVKFDLTTTLVDRAGIKSAINEIHAAKAESAPGIAVNANLENDKVVAKVTVKAKVASSYRVGAFLVEDGVSAKYAYATADWMNTSNNVIRYVDASYKGSFYGIPVADIKAGETADTMISWILEDIWAYGTERGEINGGIAWPARNNDKLHMIVFVSMSDGFGGYQIVNTVDCPINGVTPFEYK